MNKLQTSSSDDSHGFCRVNTVTQTDPADAQTFLAWLRDTANCADVRKGCDTGHCGSCAVIVDGMSVKSCSVLAHEVRHRDVYTLAGLPLLDLPAAKAVMKASEQLRPFQCGYCASAFLIAAIDHLQDMPQPTESTIRAAFAGLLCRCTGYQPIVDMVLLAARLLLDSHSDGGRVQHSSSELPGGEP